LKKTTLISEIAIKNNLPKDQVELVINEAIKSIIDALVEGDAVSFTGFGSFCLCERKAKSIFLPGSKEKVYVKAKNVVKFRPSKKLKEAVENIDFDFS